MKPYYLTWLAKQFPDIDVKKANKLDLMTAIIAQNHQRLESVVGSWSEEHYKDQLRRMAKSTAGQIKLPDLRKSGVIEAITVRKAKDQGELISRGLREQLSSDLRKAVSAHFESQGTRGTTRGRMTPGLVDKFERAITRTFEGYCVARDGEMPTNIRTIAETEVRSAISDLKHSYVSKLAENNPGRIKIRKRWVHHPGMSKKPRPGHAYMHGATVDFSAQFNVPVYSSKGSISHRVMMLHPHDPSAPLEEVLNCHCECDYLIETVET